MRSNFAITASRRLLALGRVLLGLLTLALAVWGLDAGIGLYDETMDPACKLGGLVTAPRPLKSGANRIVLREPFRTTGFRFSLTGEALREEELVQLRQGLSGSVRAWSGETPVPEREWELFFAVVMQPPVKLPAVESLSGSLARDAAPVTLGVRYHVTCDLVSTAATRTATTALHGAELPAGVPLTILFSLDQDIGARMKLQMHYAKLPRSIFPRRKAMRRNEEPNVPRSGEHHDEKDDSL